MGWTFGLGSVLGIRIRVHWLFMVLLGYLLLFGGGPAAVVMVCGVFVFVVLHELGHSLVARIYGIRVRDITLLPIGGMARLEGMAPTPKAEFWIALAGPLVNVVLAAIFLPLALLVNAGGLALGWDVFGSFAEFLGVLFAINLALAVFNLLPGFPMDGGRILRAYLARRVGMLEATRKAVRVGRWVAALMAIAGVIWLRPMLLFIALFIYLPCGHAGARGRAPALRAGAYRGVPSGLGLAADQRPQCFQRPLRRRCPPRRGIAPPHQARHGPATMMRGRRMGG